MGPDIQPPSSPSLRKASMKGPIAWMARNPVAANLLMLALLLGGLVMSTQVKKEVFPEFEIDVVVVSVVYPGASPEQSEDLVLSLENAVSSVNGVKRVTGSGNENVASLSLELLAETDKNKALADVKSAVDRITTFPRNAEEPVVSLIENRREVISLVFYGDVPSRVLREYAEEARTELKGVAGVSQAELVASRGPEIAVEISRATLRKHDLTHEAVAQAIRRHSGEVAGGGVKTDAGETLLRTRPKPLYGDQFRQVPIKISPSGATLTLEEIAQVDDGLEDTDASATFNGKNAVMLKVFRVAKQTPDGVAKAVQGYLETKTAGLAGTGVEVATWNDQSVMYQERLSLMMRNALLGFLLVLLVLGLFLEIRVAFWVTLGIPISFMGSLMLLPSMDVSINMISMFAFIVTLGIVVDDAIVVGESIYNHKQEGKSFSEAAIAGTKEVAMPVSFSILTTVVAFAPMLAMPGIMGKLFAVIPTIVISVLLMSWIESFFILPAHLGHESKSSRPMWHGMVVLGVIGTILGAITGSSRPDVGPAIGALAGGFALAMVPLVIKAVAAAFTWARHYVAGALDWFIQRLYRPALNSILNWRYLMVGGGIALFMVSVGSCQAGRLKFTFMPVVESDIVQSQVALPFGAPAEQTKAVQTHMVKAAQDVLVDLGEPDAALGIWSQVGYGLPNMGPVAVSPGYQGGHIASVMVNLKPLNKRDFGASDFTKRWREKVGMPPMVRTLVFKESIGPSSGKPINIKLAHANYDTLKLAARDLKTELEKFDGVTDIDEGFELGKPQVEFALTPLGEQLGLSVTEVGRQVRGHFYGAEALRQQRGLNEVKVMVRLPKAERESEADIDALMIRTPTGAEVPFVSVAVQSRSRGYTAIKRSDERRAINVTSEIDRSITTPDEVYPDLLDTEKGALPMLVARYPGLSFNFDGERREQMESMGSLLTNSVLALFLIFALIAIPFKSYVHPITVLFAVPLGVGGALYGHLMMGYDLSMISVLGIVALSGVVINDSLVLVDAANQARRNQGMNASDAIKFAATRRFRPILLTSLTTFFGLAPMIFETSMQARFLIPMAISLGFGILLALPFLLTCIPAMYLVIEDIRKLLGFDDTMRGSKMDVYEAETVADVKDDDEEDAAGEWAPAPG
ncbi:MAG: multidrug efflux pump subunit AcrB [Myxococcota bacterium]|jgi:multidrug efflux pump subunit AcrB